MNTPVAVPVVAVTVSAAPACPGCGTPLPLARPVRAARLRCPAAGCGARLRIRGGVVLHA